MSVIFGSQNGLLSIFINDTLIETFDKDFLSFVVKIGVTKLYIELIGFRKLEIL